MYQVILARNAQKDLDRLRGETFDRVVTTLRSLATDPRPAGSVKLAGQAAAYRVRVGDYRILYDVDDERHELLVLRVKHRREAYRGL